MLARDLRDERSSYAALSLPLCDRLAGMTDAQLYGLKLWFVNRSLADMVIPDWVCLECGRDLPPIDIEELL